MTQTVAGGTTHKTPVTRLSGIGPKLQERLNHLGITCVEDLLFHLPLRYEDRTRLAAIGSLHATEHVVIEGEIQLSEIKFGKRRMLLCRLSDGTGWIQLRFFHFSKAQQESLGRGNRIRCYGEVRRGPKMLEMVHPEYQQIMQGQVLATEENLTPVYPTAEGLHQIRLRKLAAQAMLLLQNDQLALDEYLPDNIIAELRLPTLKEALLYVHQPPTDAALQQLADKEHPTQQRLAVDELLAHTLSLRRLRQQSRLQQAIRLNDGKNLTNQFIQLLPFSLTKAQQRVVKEIEHDLQQSYPMQRLVQGDVGSGKTVVAALALLKAVASGKQAAMMAPTEILAEQHRNNLQQWFETLGVKVAWLSGKQTAKQKREAVSQLESGEADVVIGTHALFQEGVSFKHLALVVIDEQHRFGVHQRFALRDKGVEGEQAPHQLIMTATPIPRTLTMTAYADLDCSVIDELPPGRQAIETVVVPDARRDEIVQRVHKACRQGRQVYWVCTLIEESDVLQAQAAEDTAAQLAAALPDIRIGLVHGRLKPEQKARVMQAFKDAKLDLLVATTVIEVGVDVPNASLMIIDNAERLGLSQLHQLRGRVGRGSQASACVLMYQGSLSENARERLAIMRESNDGFVIARKDLEIRGPGEVLGTRQTGMLQMRIADLQRDQALMPQVQQMADLLLEEYPERVEPLIHRWLAGKVKYGDV